MPETDAGTWVRCPACGVVMTVPSESTPVLATAPSQVENEVLSYASKVPASPMDSFVAAQAFIPEKLRSPGKPACYLVLITRGAEVNASFDITPVINALAAAFAKKVRKQYDVQIVAKAPEGSSCAVIRIAQIDEGNRFLRYFLSLLAGKTVLKITGHVRGASGKETLFQETHKGAIGIAGGAGINLLKTSAKVLGARIGKKALK